MKLKSVVGGCASAALALTLAACTERETPATIADDRPATTGEMPEGTGGTNALRVADVVEDPMQYQGRTVTVEADVEEVLGPMAFVLDEDSPFEGGIDNDLIVFSPKSGQLADIDDQWMNNKVRVTGRVAQVNIVEVEREVGWDLDPQIEAELEGRRAVLIAESVERLQN